MSPAQRLVAVLLAALAVGCQQMPAATPGAPAAARAWDALVDEFIETTFAAHPHRAVRAGRHEFDGRLPDLSRAALDAEVRRLRDFRARATAIAPAGLAPRARFDREYLLAEIQSQLFWLEDAEQPFVNPAFYSSRLDPSVYLERDYAPLEQRMRAYIAYAGAVPRAVEQARANLRTPMARTFVHLGRQIFGGLATFYEKDVPPIFAPVADEGLQRKLAAANAGAIRAMRAFDAWFGSQEAAATGDYAIGAERFQRMLRETEQIDLPLARLREMGSRDLARNLAAMREACSRFAPGESVKACVDTVQARKPAEGPVRAAMAQLAGLRSFIVERRIVSIPSAEIATVDAAPRYRRWNAAYISTPGPYERNLPSIYFIAPPDPTWSAAEQAAYIPDVHDLLFISVHEVWPGHFLHHLHAARSGKLGPLFRSYAFSEGWAHYAEEMMWESGLGNGDPADHVGQLLNALLRNVRYLSAIGLHTGGMTVAESEAMFREMAFQDPGNARQQAARGTFDPGYGNYTLGKLMIRELRDEWTAPRGGRRAWQAFHDQFLSYGAPPIPLVRKAILSP